MSEDRISDANGEDDRVIERTGGFQIDDDVWELVDRMLEPSDRRRLEAALDSAPDATTTRTPMRRPYHERFRNFHPRTISATSRLFRSGPWTGPPERQQDRFERWLRRCSRAYRVPPPDLRIVPPEECGGYGRYDAENCAILLPRFSVLTLFHEFRHHMQFCGVTSVPFPRNAREISRSESDARAWSQSLFYRVRPERYQRLRETGRIFYP